MNIVLMHNNSDLNVLGKDLSTLKTVQGNFKAKTDIVNPVLTINGIDNIISKLNYCYIPVLNRYYFITGISSVRDDLWELNCHCDVLETYKAKVKETEAVISRQEFEYNLLLDDGTLKAYADPMVQVKAFSQSFNDDLGSVVLVIAGS